MEQSVNDASIDYVLILCDQVYQAKANNRDGSGVSTETIIMSSEVYKQRDSSKYIPIACEFNSSGEAYLPTFVKVRKYVPFNDLQQTFDESLIELLRLLFNEPAQPKPPLGKKPNFAEMQDISFIQGLKNQAFDIQRIAITNTVHSETMFKTQFTDQFENIFEQWDESIEAAGANTYSEQLERLLPIVQIYLRTYQTIGPESPDAEIRTIERTARLLASLYSRGTSLNHYDTFTTLRYLWYLGIGSIMLRYGMYTALKKLIDFVYIDGPVQTSFKLFYPLDLVRNEQDSKATLRSSVQELGNEFVEPFVQFDMLLYYLKDEKSQPERWWYPLLHELIKPRNLSFPMLSALMDKNVDKDIIAIFDETNVQNVIDRLNQVKAVGDTMFPQMALPSQFYRSNIDNRF